VNNMWAALDRPDLIHARPVQVMGPADSTDLLVAFITQSTGIEDNFGGIIAAAKCDACGLNALRDYVIGWPRRAPPHLIESSRHHPARTRA